MIKTTRRGIEGAFELKIIRGTTPSYWYDTPDPYVKLPGWFGSSTSTKKDTASPVWNEVLTTLDYSELYSVTLQLYDEDYVSDDHIIDFTADLRPWGKDTEDSD